MEMTGTDTLIDVKHCDGCEDDFYNGKNPYGVEKCWNRSSARLVQALLIPIDLAPPYSHIKVQNVPHCYKKKRYATVKPESLDSRGYWRMEMNPQWTPANDREFAKLLQRTDREVAEELAMRLFYVETAVEFWQRCYRTEKARADRLRESTFWVVTGLLVVFAIIVGVLAW